MIVGADHLQLAVPDGPEPATFLASIGYRPMFEEPDIFAGRTPSPLYRGSVIRLAWYQAADGGVPVELITSAAGLATPGYSSYEPLLRRRSGWGAGGAAEPGFCPALQVCLDFRPKTDGAESGPVLDTIRVRTPVIEASRQFWTAGLGFALAGPTSSGELALVMPKLLVGPALHLWLRADAQAQEPQAFIDGSGSAILGFVSTDIERDLDRLSNHGGRRRGSVIEIEVNRRRIAAGFALGPGGEPVELIQPV